MAELGPKLHPTSHGWERYQALACSGDHRPGVSAAGTVPAPAASTAAAKRQWNQVFMFGQDGLWREKAGQIHAALRRRQAANRGSAHPPWWTCWIGWESSEQPADRGRALTLVPPVFAALPVSGRREANAWRGTPASAYRAGSVAKGLRLLAGDDSQEFDDRGKAEQDEAGAVLNRINRLTNGAAVATGRFREFITATP